MDRRAGTPWITALALVSFALGWAHPLIHFLSVPHHVCAHGGLAHGSHAHVDAEGHEHSLEEPAADPAEDENGPVFTESRSDADHGRCTHPSFESPKKTLLTGSFGPGSPLEEARSVSLLETERVEFAAEVWRFAPKQSPPVFA